MEVIIVTFLEEVATVDVLTANNNDVSLVKTRTVQFARLLNRRLLVLFEQTHSTAIYLHVLVHYISCSSPEIPRDIALIPSLLKRVQRWQVS